MRPSNPEHTVTSMSGFGFGLCEREEVSDSGNSEKSSESEQIGRKRLYNQRKQTKPDAVSLIQSFITIKDDEAEEGKQIMILDQEFAEKWLPAK